MKIQGVASSRRITKSKTSIGITSLKAFGTVARVHSNFEFTCHHFFSRYKFRDRSKTKRRDLYPANDEEVRSVFFSDNNLKPDRTMS